MTPCVWSGASSANPGWEDIFLTESYRFSRSPVLEYEGADMDEDDEDEDDEDEDDEDEDNEDEDNNKDEGDEAAHPADDTDPATGIDTRIRLNCGPPVRPGGPAR